MWLLMWLSFYTWSLVDCFYKEKGHSWIYAGKTNNPLRKIFGNMINMQSELWNINASTFRKYGIICIAIYRMIPDEESGIRNGNVRVSIKSGPVPNGYPIPRLPDTRPEPKIFFQYPIRTRFIFKIIWYIRHSLMQNQSRTEHSKLSSSHRLSVAVYFLPGDSLSSWRWHKTALSWPCHWDGPGCLNILLMTFFWIMNMKRSIMTQSFTNYIISKCFIQFKITNTTKPSSFQAFWQNNRGMDKLHWNYCWNKKLRDTSCIRSQSFKRWMRYAFGLLMNNDKETG